ncbi:hypothetical protein Leryth_007265 [Lithospermum erythrorhizon]|nr:hypothetical protein Leryth_007265 [Lithospermum erythrorhizon]
MKQIKSQHLYQNQLKIPFLPNQTNKKPIIIITINQKYIFNKSDKQKIHYNHHNQLKILFLTNKKKVIITIKIN